MREAAIRLWRPEDALAAWQVVKTVFDEYGFTLDAMDYDLDLRDIPGQYRERGGGFWVAEAGGQIVGTVAVRPVSAERAELRRLYLVPSARRLGLGRRLIETVVDWAREHGFAEVDLWSDVLFERAHTLYEAAGFARVGFRIADDPDQSREHHYLLRLGRRDGAGGLSGLSRPAGQERQ